MDTSALITTRNTIAGWDADGRKPFAMVNSVVPAERSRDILNEASAILSMLSAACFDANAVSLRGSTSEFNAVNPKVLAGALSGVSTLIDFANFLLED